MDDTEGGLSFDFEGGLDSTLPPSAAGSLIPPDAGGGGGPVPTSFPSLGQPAPGSDVSMSNGPSLPGKRSFRQTVCRHWLRALCMKGEACGFLHQFDKDRMPVCRFFRLYGECREQDCVYKHTNEDIKECNMYKLGFCPNGPDCRYRHAKLPGPPPPVEEVFQKIQHLNNFNYNQSNRFFQNRNAGYTPATDRPQIPQPTASVNPETTLNASLVVESINKSQSQPVAQSEPQVQQLSQQPVVPNQTSNIINGLPNKAIRSAMPLPQGQSRYFIVKSCNRENLELSVQQGVWATQRSNEAKLNEAFENTENVILIFSINRTRHFQGCGKMTSKIGGFVGGGNWKYAHGTPHYGRNFSVKWLKLGELSFHKTRHLRNPFNDNLPVKISRDCQELEHFVGQQLATLLYDEPDSELWTMLVASESKREEEKVKGVNVDESAENPDIVPYEDNEEEEEEESEEEDESIGLATQMRGRGRGMMWPPPMPLVQGGRPMLGVRGFPPVMMSPDGFGFGGVGADGFSAPDMFGPRMFNPYGGPRFPGDLSGLVFPGRPSQPGAIFPGASLGMMMGANPGPFMGGMSMAGVGAPRAGRPMGMQPFRMPPPQQSLANRAPRRDQRRTGSDRYESGADQSSRGQDAVGHEDKRYQQGLRSPYDDSSGVNNFHNNDTESEDEAPRRSRKRGSNEDTTSDR